MSNDSQSTSGSTSSNYKDVPKKKAEEGGVGTTARTCTWSVDNETGQTLSFVAIAHMSGPNRNFGLYTAVPAGKNGTTFTINYETGFGASTDWWYVSFGDAAGNIYVNDPSTGWQTQCDLKSSDDGGTGYIRLNSLSSVEVVPPVSGNDNMSPTLATDN